MAGVVTALRAELAALETELAADPRYQKISKIRDLLAIYEDEAPAATPAEMAAISRQAPRSRDRSNTMTGQVLDLAEAYLRRKGARAQTTEISEAVVRAGAPLPDNPTKQRDYVSSILSHSPRFNNVRGQGYGLAEWPADQPKASSQEGEAPPVEAQQKLLAPQPNGEAHASY